MSGFGAIGLSFFTVIFNGGVPDGYANLHLYGQTVHYPREYGAEWAKLLNETSHVAVSEALPRARVSVSAELVTKKTKKVTYKVTSEKEKVRVCAVAFKDGVRSFENMVTVRTAVEGSPEAVPVGVEVTANEEHSFVWNVAADWDETLAKVAMEILVQEEAFLPQELITIPATASHAEMTFARNWLTSDQCFNALMWCAACGDEALTVSSGVVKVSGTPVASGASLSTSASQQTALLNYLYGKMGYKVLSGEDLTYAKEMTRLALGDSGLAQVAVKVTDEE